MRVAALYDIHGNLPALEAVLADVERAGADLVVVGGDIVWGTFPAQTLRRVVDLGERVTVIRGNADREVAARAGTAQGLDPPVAVVNEWCADQLTPDERDFLAGLPEATTLRLGRLGTVLFCHGTPRSDEEIVTAATPDDELLEAVGGSSADVIVCGHVHVQFDRRVGDKRVVNAGSVGMPYEDEPGAYWLLLDDDVHHRRTVYDFERAGEASARVDAPTRKSSPATSSRGPERRMRPRISRDCVSDRSARRTPVRASGLLSKELKQQLVDDLRSAERQPVTGCDPFVVPRPVHIFL